MDTLFWIGFIYCIRVAWDGKPVYWLLAGVFFVAATWDL